MVLTSQVAMVLIDDSMMTPRVEALMTKVGSKFKLVTLASLRAREINSYYNHLKADAHPGAPASGTSKVMVPPQVTSKARKPLSIAFEEIALDKIECRPLGSADGADDATESETAVDEAAE